MSKQVKQKMCKEMAERLNGVDSVIVIDPTPLDGITANTLRREMARVNVRMLLVKNSLIRRVLAGTPLEPVGQLLDGPCALAWGGESIIDVARLVVSKIKEMPKLVIKGAVMEGSPLDAAGAADLSKLPSKAEMRAMLVGSALSPGRKLAAAVLGSGAMIANLLKGRIEALEKKEPAAPAPVAA